MNVKYVNIELVCWTQCLEHVGKYHSFKATHVAHHLPFPESSRIWWNLYLLTTKNRLLIRGPKKFWYARRVNYVKGGFLQADLFRTKFFARKMICSWPCPSSWNAFASNTTRPRTPSRRSTTRSPRMAKRSPVTKRIGKFPIRPLKPELFIQCSFHIESVTWTFFRSTQPLGTAHLVDQVVSFRFPTDFFCCLCFCYLFSPIIMGSVGKWAPYMKRKRIIGDTHAHFSRINHDYGWKDTPQNLDGTFVHPKIWRLPYFFPMDWGTTNDLWTSNNPWKQLEVFFNPQHIGLQPLLGGSSQLVSG